MLAVKVHKLVPARILPHEYNTPDSYDRSLPESWHCPKVNAPFAGKLLGRTVRRAFLACIVWHFLTPSAASYFPVRLKAMGPHRGFLPLRAGGLGAPQTTFASSSRTLHTDRRIISRHAGCSWGRLGVFPWRNISSPSSCLQVSHKHSRICTADNVFINFTRMISKDVKVFSFFETSFCQFLLPW